MFLPPRQLGGYFYLALLAFFASLTAGVGATFTVQMKDFQFDPVNQAVTVGDTVTWTNVGIAIHTSTGGTDKIPNGLWDSGNKARGTTFSLAFNGAPGDYPYYCTPHALPPFNMQAKITVTPANLAPLVSIINPISGASFASGTPIAIQAEASDSDGTVARVDFFANGQPLGASFSPPFGVLVSSLVPGNYALTAVATDNAGATGNSSAVNISVLRGIIPPTVTITNPVNSQAFLQGSDVLIEASAADADGVVRQVEFILNSVSVGRLAAPPYSLTLSNLALGDYTLSALATDNDGATSASAAVAFSVIVPPEAPRILTAPRSQTVTVGSNVTFSVSATGTEPLFYQWQFNGTNLPDATTTNLSLADVRTNAAGIYTIVVSNQLGVTNAQATLTVELPPDISPVVTLTNPVNGTRFALGAPVTLEASATDPDGTVTKVEFFVRTNLVTTNLVGIVTNAPFRLDLNGLAAGTNFVSAVATDDRQGTGRSPEIFFSVHNPPKVTLRRDPNGTNLQTGTAITLTATNIIFGTTVTKVEFFDGAVKLGEALSKPYTFLWQPQAGLHVVSAVATDDLGQSGASTPQRIRIFAPDAVLPKVAITNSPRNFAKLTSPAITLAGVASDNTGLDRVEYQINDSPAVAAEGLADWRFTAQLQGGLNTLHVRSIDLAGNVSLEAVRFYTYVIRSRLGLTIRGEGRVTPVLDGKMLEVGKTYQLTARPGSGQVFAGWEGRGKEKVLSFRMEPELNLVATFTPNPFDERAGMYTGLYMETNGPAYDGSGFLTLQLSRQGAFSGKLTTAERALAFHGRFDVSGTTVTPVIRPGFPPLLLGLRLNTNGPATELTGSVTNMVDGEPYVAELLANRNVFSQSANRAPHVGQHLFSLASANAESSPITGTVLATIYGNGQVRFRGLMEPGGIFSVMSALSPEAMSPIYVRFGQPRAVMLGWLGFGDAVVDGDLLWLSDGTNKPPITLKVIAPQ